KKVALFGSYDWGDGQWLRDWEDRVKSCGATVTTESLKVQLTPDDSGIAECKSWASKAIA
nr:flavodoxin [Treponema sp.]